MAWWNEWNALSSFNKEPEPEPEVVPTFTDKLASKGFQYNETQDWYQRTWTTPLPEGIDTCLEVYKKNEDSTWTSIMYGTDGGIFYEQNVGTRDVG